MLLRRIVVLIALFAPAVVAGVIAWRKPNVDQQVRAWRDRDYQLAWLDDAEIQRNVDVIFTRVAADMNPIEDRHETVTGLSVKPKNESPGAGCVVEIDALKWYGCGCCEYSPEPSTFNDQDFAYISQLPDVQKMTLSLTQVTDVGLRSIERLEELTWLDMSEGQFTDDALRSVGSLHALESLNLSGNRMDGSGLRFLSKLRRLKTLDLTNTDLTDDAMQHLANLPSLEFLLLDRTAIRGPGLRHLAGLHRLKKLSMSETRLTSDALSDLPPLPALEECNVNTTDVASGLWVFEEMPALRLLDLGGTDINDNSLADLSNVVWLESLVLHDTDVGDEGIRHLAGMTSLTYLYLSGTRVNGAAIRYLKNCSQLQHFTAFHDNSSAIDLDESTAEAISMLKNLAAIRVRLTQTGSDRPSLRLHDMPRLGSLTVFCPNPVDEIELLNVSLLNFLQIVGEPKDENAGWPVEYEEAAPVRRIAIRNAGKQFYEFEIPIPEEFECDGPELISGTKLNGRLTRQFARGLEKAALVNQAHLHIAAGSEPQAIADLLSFPTEREKMGSLELSIEIDEFNAAWSRALTRGMSEIPRYSVSLRIRANKLAGESPISLGGISQLRHLQLEGFSGLDHLRLTAEDMPPDLEYLTFRDAEIGTLEFESCHVPVMAVDMRRFDRLLINGYESPYHNLQLFHDWTRPSNLDSQLLHAPEVVELRDLPYVKYCDMRYGDGVRELRVLGNCPRLKQAAYVPSSVNTFPEELYRAR